MDKDDIKQMLGGKVEKLQTSVQASKVVLTRQLKDLSIKTVFLKAFMLNGAIALIISILLFVLIGILSSYNCNNEMQQLVSDAAFSINTLKTSDTTLTQGDAKTRQILLDTLEKAKDSTFVSDGGVVLFNISEWKVDNISSQTIQIDSEDVKAWFCQIVEDDTAIPIIVLPQSLKDFASKYNDKNLVITKLSEVNRNLVPEKVEARGKTKVIDTWEETPQADPNRTIYTEDVPMKLLGNDDNDEFLTGMAGYKFESELEKIKVVYNEDTMPKNTKVVSQQFTTAGTTYEVDMLYRYEGLSALWPYMLVAMILLWGTTILITAIQTKKDREF